ncbi:MAG: VCBS repeat-containing protein [Desulfobacteraceae bacterium]|nr:VCBS repeat-containing protein [Desulfobacteraceae bacterium]
MPRILLACVSALLLLAAPHVSSAAPLKTYVAEFNVAGAANKDELKVTLQGLLASRLNPGQAQLVEKPEQSELQLFGSYAQFGKMFSVDVLIKNSLNGSLSKVYEQGESQDDLLPAFGRLARKLDNELAKVQQTTAASAAPVPAPQPAPAETKTATTASDYKVAAPVSVPSGKESYVVKSDIPPQNAPGTWSSEPLTGVFSSLALGRTLPSGEREIFIAGGQSIRYLRKGAGLKQVAGITLPVSAKILAIDTADLDHDGVPELYVSIVDRKTVSSRVYLPSDNGLELIAENLPWLLRGIGPGFKGRTVFGQAVSSSGEYQGDIAELVKSGRHFDASNARILPRPGNIFNFSRFKDGAGADRWIVMDEDGYLIVFAADGSELWKSSDKYGGSETYFNYESVSQLRAKADNLSWNFLEQRITALPDGTLIVPRNEGSFSIGNNRSYNKHTLFGLQWSGAMLREAWHTRLTPSYLADYAYDADTHEVLLLEVIQHAGLFNAGKTVISINKLD